jgi:hypothetical protein
MFCFESNLTQCPIFTGKKNFFSIRIENSEIKYNLEIVVKSIEKLKIFELATHIVTPFAKQATPIAVHSTDSNYN